jgi:hypothetical protein
MSQHDITMQLKDGGRETLGKKSVSNHGVRPEGNQLQDAGVYCCWRIQHFQCVVSKFVGDVCVCVEVCVLMCSSLNAGLNGVCVYVLVDVGRPQRP